jgi:hypothetical protein
MTCPIRECILGEEIILIASYISEVSTNRREGIFFKNFSLSDLD